MKCDFHTVCHDKDGDGKNEAGDDGHSDYDGDNSGGGDYDYDSYCITVMMMLIEMVVMKTKLLRTVVRI